MESLYGNIWSGGKTIHVKWLESEQHLGWFLTTGFRHNHQIPQEQYLADPVEIFRVKK